MALMQCSFYSETLGVCASMNVIVPQPTLSQIGMASQAGTGKHRTLYLLHGLSDDHTIWLRRTSIERYAAAYGLAVVMPAVNRSFYTDMAHGAQYWTFVSEELPALARAFFPLSEKREDTFVAGLSMGGYGAFKLALRCPDKFAAAASLSGALDLTPRRAEWPEDFANIFADPYHVAGTEDDLFHLARKLVESGAPRPKLFQCCGTEDFLYADNQRFREEAVRLGLDLHYDEGPGTHEWGYWDTNIQRVLAWLPLSK